MCAGGRGRARETRARQVSVYLPLPLDFVRVVEGLFHPDHVLEEPQTLARVGEPRLFRLVKLVADFHARIVVLLHLVVLVRVAVAVVDVFILGWKGGARRW
jgi:hypothetical protein